MKTIFLLFVLALTSVSYAHCGACGEGSAEEHREKGEDYDHHDEEYEKELEESFEVIDVDGDIDLKIANPKKYLKKRKAIREGMDPQEAYIKFSVF